MTTVTQLVKYAYNTREHPGYKYVYFRSLQEFLDYFQVTLDEPWVQEYLSRYSDTTGNATPRELEKLNTHLFDGVFEKAAERNYYVRFENNYEYMAKHLIKTQGITDHLVLYALLRNTTVRYLYNALVPFSENHKYYPLKDFCLTYVNKYAHTKEKELERYIVHQLKQDIPAGDIAQAAEEKFGKRTTPQMGYKKLVEKYMYLYGLDDSFWREYHKGKLHAS